MKKVLLIGISDIINGSVIEDNVDVKLLAKTLSIVQEVSFKPIIGKTLYDGLIEGVYNTSTGATLDAAYINLISAAKPYLIAKTVADFIIINNFKVTNKGLQKLNDNSSTSLSGDDINGVKDYYNNLTTSYKSDLVKYLKDNNLIDYKNDIQITSESTGWFFEGVTYAPSNSINEPAIEDYIQAESTYTYQQLAELRRTLLISSTDIISNSTIEDNVDVKLLARTIQQVQEVNLKPILTEPIYNNLINGVYQNKLSGATISSLYVDLLSLVKPYLINKVVAEFIIPNNYKFTAKGLMSLNDNSATALSNSDLESVKDYYDNISTSYKEEIIKFLRKYKLAYGESEITSDASGWFLDGITKSCINPSNDNVSLSSIDKDTYTTGTTLIGNTVYFNRNDKLSAYTVDLGTIILTGASGGGASVSGVSFNNNVLRITDSTGGTYTTLINNFSGLTVNGSVSATTYFGNGSNLTGISSVDTYTTGATFNNNNLVLTNNSGGTVGALINYFSGVTVSGVGIFNNAALTDAIIIQPLTNGEYYSPKIRFKETGFGTTSQIWQSYGGILTLNGGNGVAFGLDSYFNTLIRTYPYTIPNAPDNEIVLIRNLLGVTNAVNLRIRGGVGQTTALQEWQDSNSNVQMTFMPSGNVGIGTSSPTNRLTVTASTDPVRVLGLTSGTTDTSMITIDATGVLHYKAISAATSSSSGLINAVTASSATTLTMNTNIGIYIFYGVSASTYTLPVISGNTNAVLYVKNRGNANVTLTGITSGSLYTTLAVSTAALLPGDSCMLVDDGTYWNMM